MVKDYLEKLQSEYVNQKLDLQEQIKKKRIQLKENIEFIKLLDETSDTSYESFTPREVNSKNKTRILELKQNQKILIEELNQLKETESEWIHKLDELDSVIKVEKHRNKIQDEKFASEIDCDKLLRLKLLETQENERQRISRELHDSTVQNLTSLVHKSELCSKLIDMDPVRCKLELTTLNRTLRDIINNTRQMIYNLRPMSFDDIGLDVTIQDALRKIENSSSVKIAFNVEGESFPITSIIGITILRIIQEGCNNAIRHGNAQLISVTLSYMEKEVTIKIEDNGSGFKISQIPDSSREDNSGFGLSMMKERVFLLSGTIQIVSNRGEGTTITAKIPVTEKEERVDG